MKIDMRFHVVGRGKDIDQADDQVFFYPEDNNTLLTRVLYRLAVKCLGEAGADFDQIGTIDTDAYLTLIYKHLSTSEENRLGGVARARCHARPKLGQTRQEKN